MLKVIRAFTKMRRPGISLRNGDESSGVRRACPRRRARAATIISMLAMEALSDDGSLMLRAACGSCERRLCHGDTKSDFFAGGASATRLSRLRRLNSVGLVPVNPQEFAIEIRLADEAAVEHQPRHGLVGLRQQLAGGANAEIVDILRHTHAVDAVDGNRDAACGQVHPAGDAAEVESGSR